MAKYFQQQQGPNFSLDFGAALPSVMDRRLRWIFVAAAVVLLFFAISFLRGVYTDLLWFEQLGFRSIFLKVVYTRVALFAAGAVIFAVPATISLFFAYRLSQGPEEQALPAATQDFLRKLIIWGAVAAVVVLSVVFGTLAAAQWEAFLRLANAAPFGINDPVYGNDISFYVFTLPVYDFVRSWLLGAAIAVLLASLGYYFVNFSYRGAGFQITPAFKIHVSIIAAFIMFVLAFGHWLDRWALLLSDEGAIFGAAYADLNARRPALAILTVIAAASGVLILVNAYMRGIRLLVGGLALWAVMAFLLGTAWPSTMQRLTVRPNEFAREEPYIARSIGVHARRLRPERHRGGAIPRELLPHGGPGGAEPGDDRQHTPLGPRAAGAGLPTDTAHQAVLRLQGRRRRPLLRWRRVPAGDAGGEGGCPREAGRRRPDVDQHEAALHARLRIRHEPCHGVHPGGATPVLRQGHTAGRGHKGAAGRRRRRHR